MNNGVKLEAANSEIIAVKGMATFLFKIEDFELEWKAFVADISDNGIIGYDFLYYHDCELAARHGLSIMGKVVPCNFKGLPSESHKVSLTNDVIIPAYSEAVIYGEVDISHVNGKLCFN